MIAYCYRDGHIQLTDEAVPEGAIELYRGPAAAVRKLVRKTTDGPGRVPDLADSTSVADDQQALLIYLETAKAAADRSVTVNDLSRDVLEADA